MVDEHIASRKKKYGQHFDTVIVVLWTLSWYASASASYWYCMQSGGTTLASVQLGLLWAMAIFNLCDRPPLHSLSFSSPRGSVRSPDVPTFCLDQPCERQALMHSGRSLTKLR